MPVVGRNALIICDTGKKADVNAFTPSLDALRQVRIVDAAVLYEHPYTYREYILILKDALLVLAMKNNLIPTFITREAGITVNTTPKIHIKEPAIEDHSIYFKDDDLWIPLSLEGVFSYFPTSKPTKQQAEGIGNVYFLTPEGGFNPHTDVYAKNEASMIDWEGNMIGKRDRVEILLEDVELDKKMISDAHVSSVEAAAIDSIVESVSSLEVRQ